MFNRVIQGDCLIKLKELEDNSVDSIVTDPPYELGFMGKSWDNTGIANNVEMWKECLRVLKPGGHLLAFSGTRTYHRMASAIEDAGFEVRDMIEWVYGCLSEDTEILTESGYKLLHKLTQYDRIGVYDITNNIYKWERPQRWSVYKVHQDTAYRIKSDYTDQIVSRNHRCLVEREGKLVFIQAEELNEVEYMPTLSEDFYSLQKDSNRKLLLKELLWKGKRLAQKVFSKWTGNKKSEERIEVRKEPSLERWSNLLEETRKLQADKICEVSEGVFTDGEKRWICNGTSFDNGSILGDMFRENPSSASYQSRPTGQPTGKPDVISIKQGTQITRRARVTKIEYSGIIFCPTVSTGAFIARRNGQVFITGNSGFPKSRNIGLDVDKRNGVTKNRGKAFVVAGQSGQRDKDTGGDLVPGSNTMGAYIAQNEWSGWGTALKPAHEPICMARKPLAEKTVAENCLKWGTGGINIDESRVETDESLARPYGGDNEVYGEYKMERGTITGDGLTGRFPANLIHDNSEEVRECFPDAGGGKFTKTKRKRFDGWREMEGRDDRPAQTEKIDNYGDSGNASRFFKSIIYQAKSSKSERNKGLDSIVLVDILRVWNENNTTKEEKLIRLMVTGISPQKVIGESGMQLKNANEWNTCLFGKHLMEKYQEDIKSITKTETNSITTSQILNWLIHLLTNEYIVGANLEMENGGNLVANVENSNTLIITINEAMALALGVESVQSGTQLKINVKEGSNIHSTVKPIALMEYLIKMVTPKGGIVLDPFAGSGSTLVAAKQNGFNYIGIEMTEEYIPIIEARLK